ncbi:hemerythrin domain-containing protein [Streptomyces silvisoli]|uniref:Hemerythrin domain-containing protein n=1 Tax=Streptomyces silvisoli TaxID=3034235 RepID=A0ABT5ZDE6_9ACTN|nr:hemerythrin domain-containing protein [Streptomyces silvisoli]MDF3287777.1 hemerythrin domain-containing protein [Streptomyces silvisoli]
MTEHATVGQAPESNDVVLMLERQHQEIRRQMDEVLAAEGKERQKAFHRLVRQLMVHETAEAEVVHPFARRTIEGGQEVVSARLAEERETEQLLGELHDIVSRAPEAAEFSDKFGTLRDAVAAHMESEERFELPQLREAGGAARVQLLAKLARAAEILAPTRPHPRADSAVERMAFGPYLAVADRIRDAVRKAVRGG